MSIGQDILERLEEHCGEKIGNRRLRFQLVCELDRLAAREENLKARIAKVLVGEQTFDPETHKAIRLSKSERAA